MKYIYYSLIIIIFISILLTNYKKEHFKNLFFSGPKNIAIVGNGPLSEKHKKLINTFRYVYRLNHAPAYRKGDKIDTIVTRYFGTSNNTSSDKFLSENPELRNKKTIIVGPYMGNGKYKDIYVYEKVLKSDQTITKDLRLFENCKYCKTNDKCKHSSAANGPSTGILILDFLQKKYPNTKFHIFGMNFTWPSKKKGGGSPHLLNEGEIIENCVKNKYIHKTYKDDYLISSKR